jgi:hypothetical protein
MAQQRSPGARGEVYGGTMPPPDTDAEVVVGDDLRCPA